MHLTPSAFSPLPHTANARGCLMHQLLHLHLHMHMHVHMQLQLPLHCTRLVSPTAGRAPLMPGPCSLPVSPRCNVQIAAARHAPRARMHAPPALNLTTQTQPNPTELTQPYILGQVY